MNFRGYVYLLYCPIVDIYKIGITRGLKTRLLAINCIPGVEVLLIHSGMVGNMKEMESDLHIKFSAKRVKRGEWFKLENSDVEYIVKRIDREQNILHTCAKSEWY